MFDENQVETILNSKNFFVSCLLFAAGRDRNTAGVCLVLAGFHQADVDAVRRAESHSVVLGFAS
jgi:hypothetical protein